MKTLLDTQTGLARSLALSLMILGAAVAGRAADLRLVADHPLIETDETRGRTALQVRVDGGFNPEPVTVRFAVVGGTAREGVDFELPEKELVLPPFEPWGLVFLNLLDDGEVEPTRNVIVEATAEGVAEGTARFEVVIRDGNTPGKVGFISPRFSVNEAVPGGRAQVALWRTQDVRGTAEVALRLSGDGLTGLVGGPGPVVVARFEAGDSRAYVDLPLLDDGLPLGDRELRLVIESEGTTLERIPELSEAVLTIADNELERGLEPLTIREWENDGLRGVQVSGRVPRGFQQRLEYSDSGLEGPWQVLTVILGQEGEATAFDSYEASFGMRMYRAIPADPLELTLPW